MRTILMWLSFGLLAMLAVGSVGQLAILPMQSALYHLRQIRRREWIDLAVGIAFVAALVGLSTISWKLALAILALVIFVGPPATGWYEDALRWWRRLPTPKRQTISLALAMLVLAAFFAGLYALFEWSRGHRLTTVMIFE